MVNPPWLNQHGRADYTIHQHTAMGEGEVDFDGIFETLREMDFANKQLKPDAPKVGGDNIIRRILLRLPGEDGSAGSGGTRPH